VAYIAHALVIVVPFVALAAVGIALVWQHRTVATALIALGFCSVALSHIASMLVGFYAFSGPGNFADAANRVGWTLPATHWGIVVGIWVGSLSLLWHTLLQAPGRNQLGS
jgi:hypothetical protein